VCYEISIGGGKSGINTEFFLEGFMTGGCSFRNRRWVKLTGEFEIAPGVD
jgi:hypothetical protein